MKRCLLILVSSVSFLAFAGCASAHGPGYGGHYGDRVPGGVTIWSGSPYGGGYAGMVHYGVPHYAPPPPYPHAVWYRDCGHWHPRGYRHAAKNAYKYGYDQGYRKGKRHGDHRGHHGGHHRRHHH